MSEENLARGNNLSLCTTLCIGSPPAVSTSDFCDEGTGNSTSGDNFLPNAGM